jgi:predicted acyl esterase
MMASARKGALSPLNGWRSAESWPPPNLPTRYYLQRGRKLTTTLPAAGVEPIGYRFDPNNPAPTVGGANLTFERGPMDQRTIGDRADYLRFESAPLAAPMALVDVYPDGYEAIVLDAPLRARYRNGRRAEDVAMMTPGEPAKLAIELWHTAITFETGHKIALHVTSSSVPRFEVNDNSGTPPGEPAKPRVATNAVLVDADHPSALVLPILIESRLVGSETPSGE